MAKANPQSAIRRFHALGKQANRVGHRSKKRENAVWGTLEELGAETQAEKNRLMEARRFARLCDEEELDRLCGLRGKQGWTLKRTHLLQLIRVANKQQRIGLAKKCAKNGWSVRKLQLAIDRLGLHRAYGGRKQRPPKSREEALLITERLLSSLIRWQSVVVPAEERAREGSTSRAKNHKRTKVKRGGPERLPDEIRGELVKISRHAFDLCEKIRDELVGIRRKTRMKAGQRT